MHQGCAFSLPPSVALGHAYGDHSLVPDFLGPTRGPAKAQHMFRQSTTTQAAELAMTHYREATWQPMAYRSTHLLSGRRWKKRGRQQRQQAAAGNPRPEDAGTETSPGQQPRQRKQQQQRQEQQQQAPDASDEDLVVLDDPFEELEGNRRRHLCVVHDALAAGPTPYNEGWEWQKQALARLAERPNDLSSADAEVDRVLLTQHDAVFTLGTGSTLDNLRFDPKDAPFGEVVRTERGGEVTYHGPGQIVMYPIMNLRRYRQDIHWYLRALEETVIRTLAKLGLRGERVEGMTGVWVDGRKVAAVGVRVKRWVTMHGLSLNVRPNLEHFEHIVPCGIANRPVGSLEQLCDKDQDTSVERVGEILLESFEEVFRVSAVPPRLVPPPPPPPSEETLP